LSQHARTFTGIHQEIAMKIDPSLKITPPASNDARPAQTQVNQSPTNDQTDVRLSSRAAELAQMESQLSSIPLVDRARVESIKETIASGQYAINSGNIASSLLDSVKEMLHAAK
jgi:negative regulator of flagellin synthesis FlgM